MTRQRTSLAQEAAVVVVKAVLLIELVVLGSFLIAWPPPTGDGRTVVAGVAAVLALAALAISERGGGRREG